MATLNHKWVTPIDKLMHWSAGSWMKFGSTPNPILIMHFDQLIINAGTKVMESISLRDKIKGFYKGDILILVFTHVEQGVRKIKFQIKQTPSECIEKLNIYFPVMRHDMVKTNHANSTYFNIEDVMRLAIKKDVEVAQLNFTPNLKDFVKLCLLDPAFPRIVKETQKILNEFL